MLIGELHANEDIIQKFSSLKISGNYCKSLGLSKDNFRVHIFGIMKAQNQENYSILLELLEHPPFHFISISPKSQMRSCEWVDRKKMRKKNTYIWWPILVSLEPNLIEHFERRCIIFIVDSTESIDLNFFSSSSGAYVWEKRKKQHMYRQMRHSQFRRIAFYSNFDLLCDTLFFPAHSAIVAIYLAYLAIVIVCYIYCWYKMIFIVIVFPFFCRINAFQLFLKHQREKTNKLQSLNTINQ